MRVGTIAFVALVLALPSAAQAEELALAEKRPIAMVVTSPRGTGLPLPSSTAYALAAKALARIGPIAVSTPEQIGFDPELLQVCPLEERLRCYARTLSRFRRGEDPRYLTVVAMLPIGKTAKLTSLVMDLDVAIALEQDGGDVEDRIYREAIVASEATVPLLGEAELEAHLVKLFTSASPFFERSGHDRQPGTIELAGSTGFSLELDGRALGVLAGPTTKLVEVLPGARKIALEDPEHRLLPFASTVVLEPGTVARVEVLRLPDPELEPTIHPAHRVVFWSGVGLAAIGSAITIWAIAVAPGAERTGVCSEPGCSSETLKFASFCELTSDRPSECEGGLLGAPLGLSLIGGGATTSLLTELAVPSEVAPWWPPLLGVATGLVLYGLLAVAQ